MRLSPCWNCTVFCTFSHHMGALWAHDFLTCVSTPAHLPSQRVCSLLLCCAVSICDMSHCHKPGSSYLVCQPSRYACSFHAVQCLSVMCLGRKYWRMCTTRWKRRVRGGQGGGGYRTRGYQELGAEWMLKRQTGRGCFSAWCQNAEQQGYLLKREV